MGGTAGIGESTLKAFAKHTIAPRIYLVGQRQASADRISEAVKEINSSASVTFLQADCTSIKEVDRVCAEAIRLESAHSPGGRLNLLVLTPGFFSLEGRTETAEGVDRKMALNYYSRMRFATQLAPLLDAASRAGQPSRVVSVLAAGREGKLFMDDLDLKTHFSLPQALNSCASMNSLTAEELAKQNPGTAYIHTDPGIVKTSYARDMPWYGKMGYNAVFALLGRFIATDLVESGERHLFMGMDARFKAKGEKEGENIAVGSNGVKGSGAYLLKGYGQTTGSKTLQKLREMGSGKTVFEHMREVHEKAVSS